MKTYDPVEAAKGLLDELVVTKAYLDQISIELKKLEKVTEENAESWEELYEKEFELSIKLHGIHGDLQTILRRQVTDLNEFQLKRVYQEAEKVFQPLVLEL